MSMLLASLALLASAQPAPAPPIITTEPIPLAIEQQAALRCSIAIALAAEQQRSGTAEGEDWPDLTERGREFFVRSLAKLMEETGMSREMLLVHGRREVEDLQQPGRLDAVMPACLLMLEASGL